MKKADKCHPQSMEHSDKIDSALKIQCLAHLIKSKPQLYGKSNQFSGLSKGSTVGCVISSSTDSCSGVWGWGCVGGWAEGCCWRGRCGPRAGFGKHGVKAVVEAILSLKAAGQDVLYYPFILMDIPAGNGLPVSTISKIYILAVPIMLLVGAGILFSPSFLPDLILPKFLEYSALASEGVIINSRPWTYIQPGNDYWHYLLIVLTRFVYFFAFADAAFSTSHNLINCLFYIPFYILILISVTKSFGTQDTADITLANLSLFLFSGIMVFATFHSVTLIDFDWRYRASTHPMMAIMAAHGLYVTYQYWQRKTVIMAQ